MKKMIFAIMTMASSIVSADPLIKYYTGSKFEQLKSVQMVGVERTPENIAREENIMGVLEVHRSQITYCYERTSSRGDLSQNNFIFYFVVKAEGDFSNVSADLIDVDATTPNVAALVSCIGEQMKTFKAPPWVAERTFRFRLRLRY